MKKLLLLFVMTCISFSAKAYDLQYGNYYFNRLERTATQDIGGVNTISYNVEATSKEGGYSHFQQTYSGPINPPATFQTTDVLNGKMVTYKYTLTSIGDMAFANNSFATELTIPATVTNISDMGLLACMSLKKVTCLATTPPSHTSNYFLVIQDVSDSATLYVPKGSKAAYQRADGWSAFKNIVEIEPSFGEHHFVDLGLPSGKLWSTTNYGASSEIDYGTFISWTFSDVVKSGWGDPWKTPSKTEYQELVNNCTWTWTSNNGVNGYEVTGTNGNSMFLPAAGFQIMGYPQSAESQLYYWSSTQANDGFAYMLVGSSDSYNANSNYNTSIMSAPIRPIVDGITSGVREAVTSTEPTIAGIYDINGRKLTTPQKGINIVKYSNGTTKKYIRK